MIEIDVIPAAGVMARGAVGTKLAAVRILCGVTRVTTWRCAFIVPIHMTRGARNAHVIPRQCEAGLAVIEVDILPISGVMTARTIVPHLSRMDIIVAGGTVRWCALEKIILMAIRASNSAMFAYQSKGCLGMIKGHVFPCGRLVAGTAICSQFSIMAIILFMAGETIRRRTFENVVYMAFLTGQVNMCR